MKSFSTLMLASLVGFSVAMSGTDGATRKDNDNGRHKRELTEDQRTCRKMHSIARAQSIVANATRINEIAHRDAARAEHFRDIALKDGPELARLQQNKTLVNYCEIYGAHERTARLCYQVKNLEKLERRTKDRNAVEDAARTRHETPEEVRQRWQHDIEVAQKQKHNKTLLAECEHMKSTKPAKADQESAKQKSAASTIGSSAFAVVLVGLVASLAV